MKTSTLLVLAFAAATSLSAIGADAASSNDDAAIKISADIIARDAANKAIAPIRSAAELSAMIANGQPTALDVLSPLDRALFVQSLQFGPDGLSSFDRSALRKLSLGQTYQVLSLFGAQAHARETGTFATAATPSPAMVPLKGYECLQAGLHTCGANVYAACTANC